MILYGGDGFLHRSGLCLTYENHSALKRETTKWQDGRDTWWQDIVPKYPTKCDVEWVDAEDPQFLLYTSGSTGKPKGVLHTSGGYMVYTVTTFKYSFDYKPSDIYLCTADGGWITGHSYVTYGPLLNGASVVVFKGAPNYPDPGRCWEIVDKYKVTIFYTAPTLVRSLVRACPNMANTQGANTPITPKSFIPFVERDNIVEKQCTLYGWARRLIAHGLIQSTDPNLLIHGKNVGSGNFKIALTEVVNSTCQLWLHDGFHESIGEVGVGGFVV